MFHEVVDGSGGDGVEAATLLAAFEAMLAEAIDEIDAAGAGDGSTLDPATIERIHTGDAGDLTVEEAVSVLAAADGRDADAMVAELRDHLLMGMATAVLDVDTIAAAIDADLTGQEVQQVLEGRAAMTLAQLAEVMAVVETRKP